MFVKTIMPFNHLPVAHETQSGLLSNGFIFHCSCKSDMLWPHLTDQCCPGIPQVVSNFHSQADLGIVAKAVVPLTQFHQVHTHGFAVLGNSLPLALCVLWQGTEENACSHECVYLFQRLACCQSRRSYFHSRCCLTWIWSALCIKMLTLAWQVRYALMGSSDLLTSAALMCFLCIAETKTARFTKPLGFSITQALTSTSSLITWLCLFVNSFFSFSRTVCV